MAGQPKRVFWAARRVRSGGRADWFGTVILTETAFQLANIPSVATQQKAGWKHPALLYCGGMTAVRREKGQPMRPGRYTRYD